MNIWSFEMCETFFIHVLFLGLQHRKIPNWFLWRQVNAHIHFNCVLISRALTDHTWPRVLYICIIAGKIKLDLQLNNVSQQITRGSSRKGKKTEHMLVDSCIGYKEMLLHQECSWQIKKNEKAISIGAIYDKREKRHVQQVTGINGAGTIWAQMRGIHIAALPFYLH